VLLFERVDANIMTDKQQKAAALQPRVTTDASLENHRKAAAETRRMQDALEDDEVREVLGLLHSRCNESKPG
jgi:hypothetical protein